ncbi:MAG TPA: DUF1499 domain-containing protein [Candidatus Angelobacter sp.]|nr:DUF1499 domain-containing protein [Candidatus Angelobacter sp.]
MKKEPAIGLVNGQLGACPKTPNCVSTNQEDLNRYMLPIKYDGLTLEEAKAILREVLTTLPKLSVVKDEGAYLHAEAQTMIFEYTQDVEFLFDEATRELHFKSASRVGYTDFGSNKRRMQAVVARFIRKRDERLVQTEKEKTN